MDLVKDRLPRVARVAPLQVEGLILERVGRLRSETRREAPDRLERRLDWAAEEPRARQGRRVLVGARVRVIEPPAPRRVRRQAGPLVVSEGHVLRPQGRRRVGDLGPGVLGRPAVGVAGRVSPVMTAASPVTVAVRAPGWPGRCPQGVGGGMALGSLVDMRLLRPRAAQPGTATRTPYDPEHQRETPPAD